MNDQAAVFAAVFATLYAAHHVGDFWVQTDSDAQNKGKPGWVGRIACATHVLTMTTTKVVFLMAMTAVTGLHTSLAAVIAALAVDAISHYWADRRTTLAKLAELVPGKAAFYRLGVPRPDQNDNPCLGTGAYALDQSFHVFFLFVAALIATI